MQPIIPPVERALIKRELTQDKFLRYTNFGKRKVYVVTAHNAPNIMQELGRLREISFREGGGGTGKSADIDEFDTMPNPYKQLIVWDENDEQIIGGYRFIEGTQVSFDAQGAPMLSTTEIFKFSERFIKEYLPKTIELGRSFVQPQYQSSRNGIFSLDNLWDGLGGLVALHRDWMETFFGKVTMYTNFNVEARDVILNYLNKYHADKENLVIPVDPIHPNDYSTLTEGLGMDEAYKATGMRVRELGENIPPLMNAYIKLSPTMKYFGTCVNHHFGDVEETGIIINVADVYNEKKERHVPDTLAEVQTPVETL